VKKFNKCVIDSIDKIITNAKSIKGEITLIDSSAPDMYEDNEKRLEETEK
jgi:hypothetical protein